MCDWVLNTSLFIITSFRTLKIDEGKIGPGFPSCRNNLTARIGTGLVAAPIAKMLRTKSLFTDTLKAEHQLHNWNDLFGE